MPTSAYQPLTEAEQVFHDLIWEPMIKAGEVYLEGQVPFLALPVIKQLDETTIQAISDAIFAQIVRTVDVGAIKLVNVEHRAEYDRASEALLVAATEKGIESDEYQKAKAAALAALARFGHIGP